MRAIVITAAGGPETLEMTEIPRPVPGPHDLLVRVCASGVNRADVLQRRGRYPPPPGVPANVPGLEFAGVVQDAGDRTSGWQVGERVMGIVAGGAYAEFLVLPATHVLRVPRKLSFAEAAAVPEAYLTAHDALVYRAGLRESERVLIHAVGSGVGVALLQLAKVAETTVAGSSRTPVKLERAQELGLDRPILVDEVFSPPDDLRDWADVICDLVGGAYLPGNLTAAARLGRIVVIGLTGGRTAELDLGRLLGKRLILVGTVLRSRTDGEKADLTRSFAETVLPLFEAGRVTPILDRTFPAVAAPAAHRYMEENRNFGAIVLSWED